MNGFELRQGAGESEVESWAFTGTALAVGDLMEMDSGAASATVADSSSEFWQRKGVVTEVRATGDTAVKVIIVNPNQVWAGNVTNSINAAHNGDMMVLTDRTAVNNTGSDATTAKEVVVVQTGSDGTDGLFRFVDCSGVNPDAT